MGNDLDRQNKDNWVVNKPRRKCFTVLVIRKMWAKTTCDTTIHPTECLKLTDPNVELLEPSCTSVSKLKWCHTFGKKFENSENI